MSKDTPVEGQESWGDQVADTEESAKRKGTSEAKASPSPAASSSPAVEAAGESGAAKKRTTAED
jgi:hypothetical protein